MTTCDKQNGAKLRDTIKNKFWKELERSLSTTAIEKTIADTKSSGGQSGAIFIPPSQQTSQLRSYYPPDLVKLSDLPLASEYTDDLIFTLSREPGILSLAFNDNPVSYVVPGGRFNEFYGWDSYFIGLGLIQDGYLDLASDVATQFSFEIENYGKILNANRLYYLGRTHPPFLTDLALKLRDHNPTKFVSWINAAIKEYEEVWLAAPRYDSGTGLSTYHAQGRGIPPEVEPGHFDSFIKPRAEELGLTIDEYTQQYNAKELQDPEFDTYLLHDRSLRESGHDVTTRFVNVCADLATVDLNSLLYKYELDIYKAINENPTWFANQSADVWKCRAEARREAVDKYLWTNEGYLDYNIRTKQSHKSLTSGTFLWPLWSGLASKEQAEVIVTKTLPKLEGFGGLAATSEITESTRQWDYPAGWAPHQILAWQGLDNYGYHDQAVRLATKWASTLLKSFNTTNAVFEKYDMRDVANPHDVRAEYGNQGNHETGFGWSNASFAIAYDKYLQ